MQKMDRQREAKKAVQYKDQVQNRIQKDEKRMMNDWAAVLDAEMKKNYPEKETTTIQNAIRNKLARKQL